MSARRMPGLDGADTVAADGALAGDAGAARARAGGAGGCGGEMAGLVAEVAGALVAGGRARAERRALGLKQGEGRTFGYTERTSANPHLPAHAKTPSSPGPFAVPIVFSPPCGPLPGLENADQEKTHAETCLHRDAPPLAKDSGIYPRSESSYAQFCAHWFFRHKR